MIMRRSFFSALAICVAGTAQAATLNFNSFGHGDVVSDIEILGVNGAVTADGNSASSPDIAVAFDTRRTGTADPDLEGPFTDARGREKTPGRVLIIQENPLGEPDDDGRGGVIMFEFESPLTFLGFNIFDDATITVTSNLGDTVFGSVAEDNGWGRVRTEWEGITSLTFDFGRHSGAIDNLRFELPAEVPVPAAFPLLGGALAIMGIGARRRKG